MHTLPVTDPAAETFLDYVDSVRVESARKLDPSRRATLGQFFTPTSIARLMASLSSISGATVRLLDPCAGVGVLAAAWICTACDADPRPACIEVAAYEVDQVLIYDLRRVLDLAREYAEARGVVVRFTIHNEDFIRSAVQQITGGIFCSGSPAFDIAILNPPYGKFRTDSPERRMLREVSVETSNLYTAFVALALRVLASGGELIAITPRSFCNGPYFTPFRRDLLRLGSLTHVHVFDSRNAAFGEDEVLQENIVFRVVRSLDQNEFVTVEWSTSGDLQQSERRDVPFSQVVRPDDADAFIHIAPDDWDSRIAEMIRALRGTLASLDLQVSTGRVVDFRVKEFLRASSAEDTVPLIYPGHFFKNSIAWPNQHSKKPNALVRAKGTQAQLNPTGTYVLVKRFSAKEERRRIVAAVLDSDAVDGDFVAFENHLNYFHSRGRGLNPTIAYGLAAYLNSSLVDSYFRQFNGHTQVNATDLRKLPYPTVAQLERLAEQFLASSTVDQDALDAIVEGEVLDLPDKSMVSAAALKRIEEASKVLTLFGLPKEQTNERAALTLLALLELTPTSQWSEAGNPLRGVTPIMEFVAKHYGKQWAPNTRETVRRFTLHQFQEAGLVQANPDKPARPVNSPAYCYQVPDDTRDLLRTFGTRAWDTRVVTYLTSNPSLKAKYASERAMARIPLRRIGDSDESLSPGGQNELIRDILNQFCPLFTPGGSRLYVGDADRKWRADEQAALSALGVTVDSHGRMPDVVIHDKKKNWLVLIEAVTSHGPVNAKRHGELKELFKTSTAPLVFVTAFRDRATFRKYVSEIAWETEVWVAESPTHMIHFNGERFLGPYE